MIKLNAGFSRKVGEANFGSRGASVNLELELESSAASNPGRMREKIRAMFALARKAVDEELRGGRHQSKPGSPPKPESRSSEGPACSGCGATGLSDKVIQFSRENFGKPLCFRCQANPDAAARSG